MQLKPAGFDNQWEHREATLNVGEDVESEEACPLLVGAWEVAVDLLSHPAV